MRTIPTLTGVALAGLALGAGPAGADTSSGDDPIPGHVLPLDAALKGVKGPATAPLVARIDVEQSGAALGTFSCELFDKQAPKAVANFVGLARGLRPWKDPKTGQWVKRPFYDGLTFHRVIPEFMIQGGDPEGHGTGGPGYQLEDELVDTLKFDHPGVLAMANKGPGTNGSQFFITEAAAAHLDGKYTIFGQCAPVELVQKIARVPADPSRNRPTDPVVMKRVTVVRGAAQAAKPGKPAKGKTQ